MNKNILLNENWIFVKSAASAQEAACARGEAVTLPNTWNTLDGQDGGNDYHRGTCFYVRKLKRPALETGGRAYLECKGAAMTARVYLNGEELACHEGGYSTFRVDLTDHLQDENTLVISADNTDNQHVYPQKADFTFYGGIYRDVSLILVPQTHFALDYAGGPGIKVTPEVDLEAQTAEVTVEVWVRGAADHVRITVDGKAQDVRVREGYAQAMFQIEQVHLWDGVHDPYLYLATAELESGDTVQTRFGCRTFRVDAQEGFFLNGRSYPLRGVSRHQDRKGAGNALTKHMHCEDMDIIEEIGANTVRLAHYQHAQEFYDLCDERGIIVWAEIPYITMHMTAGRENTLNQMKELVVQCYNHPSIVCWGLSNEITAASAVNEELLENHRQLNDLCHTLDKTRFTTMADVFMLEIDSPLLEIPDVNSYNLYFGWYLGELVQNDEFFDDYHAKYPERCIGFSEYGADANPQYQSPLPEKGDYTESYQCIYHEHMMEMIAARPWLWATHLWNLFDFAADGRDEGGKHGENQKGLVTFDRSVKKDAFYLYKACWSKVPFVHVCGGRYVDRTEDVTEIKVYSNQPCVELFVDCKLFETAQGGPVYRFSVPITGEHTVEAKAGGYSSIILVRKAAEQNPAYTMVKSGAVVNWFDREQPDPAYYSVADTLAEIRESPEAGAIVNRMMEQASASRGDVAEAVKDNPALQRMMGRMTLISLLKQGGADEESMRQINRVLQKIKKIN